MNGEARTKSGLVTYDAVGEGVPLLLLHGFPHDRSLWAPQLLAPIDGVRMIAPDLPGFGGSAPATQASTAAWADWTIDFMDALSLERAIVGGLSMGGYLCFEIWRRHAARVQALVLADTKAGADTDEGKVKRREMQALARAEGSGAIADKMITGMVGKTSREKRPRVVATLDAMMRRQNVSAIGDALQLLMDRPDSTPTLGTISVPTLVLCGEEDALTPLAESRAMHDAIPGSELGVLSEAGHASNFEEPQVFNRLLSGFVSATIRR